MYVEGYEDDDKFQGTSEHVSRDTEVGNTAFQRLCSHLAMITLSVPGVSPANTQPHPGRFRVHWDLTARI